MEEQKKTKLKKLHKKGAKKGNVKMQKNPQNYLKIKKKTKLDKNEAKNWKLRENVQITKGTAAKLHKNRGKIAKLYKNGPRTMKLRKSCAQNAEN